MARKLSLVALAFALACSARERAIVPSCEAGPSALAREREAIFYGAPSSEYLALDPREQAAVVSLASRSDPSTFCSGTVVVPGWVLSAKHCTEIADPNVIVVTPEATVALGIAETLVHPSADIALFGLDGTADGELVTPIRVEDTPDDAPWHGQLVEIAGFGSTERMTSNERRFAVETVVEATPETLVVDGEGRSGACLGDSGGPLLTRSPDGSVRVAGILTSGARNCLGRDTYTRVDELAALFAILTGNSAADAPCGGLGWEGACFSGRAVWCDSESLLAETCSDAAGCGFSAEAGGYRCVSPADDACSGVDAAGTCDGAGASRCESGTLVSEPCDACEERCSRSARTGRVECTARGINGGP